MSEVNLYRVGNMEVKIILPREEIPGGVIIPRLSHGDKVIEIVTGGENLESCDGVFTSKKDFILGVTTADCAAVCLTDGERIGVAHAGWRGLRSGVIENLLKNFDSSQAYIYVNPFLHSFIIKKDSCYEEIVKKFGVEFFDEHDNEVVFRFKDALASLLPAQTIFDERSTEANFDLPSHRRDGTKDRMVTTIRFI